MARNGFRCEICGKFVSYKDINNDKVRVDFTPDTQFTDEKYEFFHNKCETKK